MKKQFTRLAGLFAGCCIAGFFANPALGQEKPAQVVQETLDWRKLQLRTSISFYIPYADQVELTLPANVNIEGHYDIGTVADVVGGVHFGTFKGVSASGTLHLRDQIVNAKTKFIVGESTNGRTTTTTFYKGRADIRKVFGPTAGIKVGSFGESGFYSRVEGGLDFQTMSHAYYKGFASAKNGRASLKLLGTVARFNQPEITSTSGMSINHENKGRFAAGGLFSINYERAPWKRIGWYFGLDGGYMKIFGVQDFVGENVALENNKDSYILEIKGGLRIGIF